MASGSAYALKTVISHHKGGIVSAGRVAAGYSIGILGLELAHPYLPGNVQNARTFDFPVLYQPVRDIGIATLLGGDPAAEGAVVEAALALERCGVDMVVGACGSFANYQSAVTQRLRIPAVMSIMCEVPFLLRSLPAQASLGVVFASTASFTDKVRRECGITGDQAARIVAIGADQLSAFQPLLRQEGALDQGDLDRQLVELLCRTRRKEPRIGMWLLQCSDLPPCAPAIRAATGLGVFDMTLLIEHLHRALTSELARV